MRKYTRAKLDMTEEGDAAATFSEWSRTRTRPTIVSIEGIPGTRKSEILALLRAKYEGSPDVVVLTEPLQYNTPMPSLNEALLDGYLKHPERHGLTFQIAYFLAMSKLIGDSIIDNLDKRIIICERSLLTARHVYFPLLREHLSVIHQEVYKTLFENGGVRHVMPDEVILLDSPVDKCYERVRRYEKFEGNRFLTKEYLQRCQTLFDQLKTRNNDIFHKLEADSENIATTIGKITEIIKRVERVEIEMLPKGPEYPYIISIEGNVGAGKSSLLSAIRNKLRLENRKDIIVLEEPVDEWVKINDGTRNILQCLYEMPNRYAFAFQTLVAVSTMKANFRAIHENPEAKIILCERSLLSSRGVFAEALKDDGAMNELESGVYDELFHEAILEWMYPKSTIYLRTSPEICLERIGMRGRAEEKNIDVGWLNKYQEYYDRAILSQEDVPPIVIEGDATDPRDREGWIDKVLELCREVLGIPLTYNTKEASENENGYMALHGQENDPHSTKEMRIPIKVRYETTILSVGQRGDSFQQIKERIRSNYPDIEESGIRLRWKRVKGGPWLSILNEEGFKKALDVMYIQGRPVVRLVLTKKEMETPHQETGMSHCS